MSRDRTRTPRFDGFGRTRVPPRFGEGISSGSQPVSLLGVFSRVVVNDCTVVLNGRVRRGGGPSGRLGELLALMSGVVKEGYACEGEPNESSDKALSEVFGILNASLNVGDRELDG